MRSSLHHTHWKRGNSAWINHVLVKKLQIDCQQVFKCHKFQRQTMPENFDIPADKEPHFTPSNRAFTADIGTFLAAPSAELSSSSIRGQTGRKNSRHVSYHFRRLFCKCHIMYWWRDPVLFSESRKSTLGSLLVQCAKFAGDVGGMGNLRLAAVELLSKHLIKSCYWPSTVRFRVDEAFAARTTRQSDKSG